MAVPWAKWDGYASWFKVMVSATNKGSLKVNLPQHLKLVLGSTHNMIVKKTQKILKR